MYLSTFKEEQITDTANLVIKSLFILAFISPTESTNEKIQQHIYREDLERIQTYLGFAVQKSGPYVWEE
jgi:hypothetical protein